MTPTQKYLESLDACAEAREWVGERSLQEAWDVCERVDWMRWLLRAPILAEYNATFAEYSARLANVFTCASCDKVRARFACPEVPQ